MKTDAELIKRQVLKVVPNSIFIIANSGTSFFEKIEWSMPDVILSDYNLPDINGLEVLLHIREKWPTIPFIFVTGLLNDEEKVAETVLKGASTYVLKQNLHLLPTKLHEVLKKAEALNLKAIEQQTLRREACLKLQRALAILSRPEDIGDREILKHLVAGSLDAIQK